MRNYIWTYWTKPQAGAVSYFDLACLGLSTALVKEHGNAARIYTDSVGAKQVEKYRIGVGPTVSLGVLQDEDPRKWALPKIVTYSMMEPPCVHLDYDVFLWSEQKEVHTDFCCQSLEGGPVFSNLYKVTFHDFLSDSGYCPPEISIFSSKEIFAGLNMGYFEVKNNSFLKDYAEKAMSIFERMKTFHRFNNIFPEQYLFYCMSKSSGVPVEVLFDNDSDWSTQSMKVGYTHLMGEKMKNRASVFRRVMARLEDKNPECHEAISNEIDWSAVQVGKSFLGAVGAVASGGFELAANALYETRKGICEACEHFDPTGYKNTGKCLICKCSTAAKPKFLKSKCPVGKWG